MDQPTCTIVAGPNGAGKTTFATRYLSSVRGGRNFLNADAIAAELSPEAPGRGWPAAGRVFLQRLREQIERRESFAFETTLSGRTHYRIVRELISDGWSVDLIYLWLPHVQVSVNRVAERVKHGGHNIAPEAILRRYSRSVRNLIELYSPVCSSVLCSDHSGSFPEPIFYQDAAGRIIYDSSRFEALKRSAKA